MPRCLAVGRGWCHVERGRSRALSGEVLKRNWVEGRYRRCAASLNLQTKSSASSLSESSFKSVAQSPLVDLRSKTVSGNDDSPDPFKARDKIPWADIGPYAHVLEVSWLS
uniref:Uncharacterized protein n=1 Tax=Physcomitrium patens TaxID=3218 RepID=A0A7I4F3W8_PHYPA